MNHVAQPDARRPRRGDSLPQSLAPIGINREQAASYIGVSPTKFDQMVADGRMPKPKKIDGRVVWSVKKLTIAFDSLPDEDGDSDVENEWDSLCSSSSRTAQAR